MYTFFSRPPKVLSGSGLPPPHVNFTITSHPPLEEVRHTLRKKDGGPISKRFKVEGGRIIFLNVSVRDSGLYVISCCDEEGEEGEETVELEVLPGDLASGSGQLPPAISQQPQQTGTYQFYSDWKQSLRHLFLLTVVQESKGDVHWLMEFLVDYAFKWKDIGEALGFSYGGIENIDSNTRGCEQCLRTLLNQWAQWPTQRHPDPPTLEKLRDALCSGWVGLGRKANEIYGRKSELPSQRS